MIIDEKDTIRRGVKGGASPHQSHGQTLDMPREVSSGEENPAEPCPNLIGTSLGSIRVVDFLGKGGMGEVYVGYDERLKRKVALKALRGDLRRQPEARARFLHEARVLSQLEHPHICRIYDLFEGEEQDFLVLELIQGKSLRTAMEEGLGRPLKLKVARQVAEVLAAAHERGFIHRDLKPDNVMLTPEGEAKVLDFGLARLAADGTADGRGPGAGKTQPRTREEPTPVDGSFLSYTATREGSIVGTLGYMSPEQARGDNATPASDMYSFGLLIQELFSGQAPTAPGDSVYEILERCERGETRTFRDPDKDLVTLVNRLKSSSPPSRPSAVDVAERLGWIAGKPRRVRLRILAAGVAAMLAATAAVAVIQAVRAHREAVRAAREAETAKQVSDFLEGMFKLSDPNEAKGRTVTAREVLDQGARKIEADLKGQPLVQARLMGSIGRVYSELGLYGDAQPLLSSALDVRKRTLGDGAPEVAQSLRDMGDLLHKKGDYASAEPLFRKALATHEAALGPDAPEVAEDLDKLATLLGDKGDFKEARSLFERAIAISEKVYGPDHAVVARVMNNLASTLWDHGDYQEAEPILRRALAIQEKVMGPDHPEVASELNNLGLLLKEKGEYEAATPLFERALAIDEKALGPDHPTVAIVLNNLGTSLFLAGRYAAARPLLERALAVSEKTLGPDHPGVANKMINLGNLMADLGEVEKALPLFEGGLKIYEKSLGPEHPRTAIALGCTGRALTTLGEGARARPLLERGLRITEKAFGPDDPQLVWFLNLLASNMVRQGVWREPKPICQRAIGISEKALKATPGDKAIPVGFARSLVLLGIIEQEEGNAKGASAAWGRAADLLRPISEGSGARSYSGYLYAFALLRMGRAVEGRRAAERLLAAGYRQPEFVALCREYGLMPSGRPKARP